MFPGSKRTIPLRCQKRLNGEKQRNCHKSSLGQRVVFWALSLEPLSSGASRIYNGDKQETNEDPSHDDPHSQVQAPISQPSQNFDLDETSYKQCSKTSFS